MKMKKVLALMMALAVVGTVGAPAITADAEGLSQAATPDAVNYGTVSAEDIELLKGLFDVNYYIEQNPDIVALCGTDYDKLFEHFVKRGVFEGRTCNANFDPSAYASAYSELKGAFGLDILKYYEHYAKIGIKENRTLTTLKACAEKGITVTTLTKDAVAITPQVFYLADKLQTKDFSTVANAVNRAAATQQTTVVETGNGTLVITPNKDLEKLKEYGTVGTLKVGEEIIYYIFSNNTGTGVYDTQDISDGAVAVYTTKDAVLTNSDYIGKYVIGAQEYKEEIVDRAVDAYNDKDTHVNIGTDYYLAANNGNGELDNRLHVSALYKPEETANIVYVVNKPYYIDESDRYSNGGHGNISYRDGKGGFVMLVADGIYNEDGTVDYFPYEYGTDEYREFMKESRPIGKTNGQIGWFDLDLTGKASSEYNIVIGSEEIDDKRTEFTIGIYNEDTGFYDYSTMHIQDKDTGNTAYGGAQSNGTAEQQNSDDE